MQESVCGILVSVTVPELCAQPQAHSRCASAQHDAQDLLSDGAGADVELCGILAVLLLSKNVRQAVCKGHFK